MGDNEDEPIDSEGGFWPVNSMAGLASIITPAAVLALILGYSGILINFLQNFDYIKMKVLCSKRDRNTMLSWMEANIPGTSQNRSKLSGIDIWRDGSILCSIINTVLPEACSNPSVHRHIPPKHGQALAFKYLDILPVFSDDEFKSNSLTLQQEQKLYQYLYSIYKAIKRLNLSSTTTKFSTAYVARGMGLVVAYQHCRSIFYIYPVPNSNQCQHSSDVKVTIKGPYNTYGFITVPSILHYDQKWQKPTDYRRALYLTSKLNNISPTTQGTSFLRKLILNHENATTNSNTNIPLKVTITETRAKVSYTPCSTGIYEICLMTNNGNIIGSPFTVPVEPATTGIPSNNDSDSEEENDERYVEKKRRIISRVVDFIDEKMRLMPDGTLVKLKDENTCESISNKLNLDEENILNNNTIACRTKNGEKTVEAELHLHELQEDNPVENSQKYNENNKHTNAVENITEQLDEVREGSRQFVSEKLEANRNEASMCNMITTERKEANNNNDNIEEEKSDIRITSEAKIKNEVLTSKIINEATKYKKNITATLSLKDKLENQAELVRENNNLVYEVTLIKSEYKEEDRGEEDVNTSNIFNETGSKFTVNILEFDRGHTSNEDTDIYSDCNTEREKSDMLLNKTNFIVSPVYSSVEQKYISSELDKRKEDKYKGTENYNKTYQYKEHEALEEFNKTLQREKPDSEIKAEENNFFIQTAYEQTNEIDLSPKNTPVIINCSTINNGSNPAKFNFDDVCFVPYNTNNKNESNDKVSNTVKNNISSTENLTEDNKSSLQTLIYDNEFSVLMQNNKDINFGNYNKTSDECTKNIEKIISTEESGTDLVKCHATNINFNEISLNESQNDNNQKESKMHYKTERELKMSLSHNLVDSVIEKPVHLSTSTGRLSREQGEVKTGSRKEFKKFYKKYSLCDTRENDITIFGVVDKQKQFWQQKLQEPTKLQYDTSKIPSSSTKLDKCLINVDVKQPKSETKLELEERENNKKPFENIEDVAKTKYNTSNISTSSVKFKKSLVVADVQKLESKTEVVLEVRENNKKPFEGIVKKKRIFFENKYSSSENININVSPNNKAFIRQKSYSEGNIDMQEINEKGCSISISEEKNKENQQIKIRSVEERKAQLKKAYILKTRASDYSQVENISKDTFGIEKENLNVDLVVQRREEDSSDVNNPDDSKERNIEIYKDKKLKYSTKRKTRFERAKFFFQSLEGSQPKTDLIAIVPHAPTITIHRSASAPCLNMKLSTREEEIQGFSFSMKKKKISERFQVNDLFRDILGDKDKRFLGIPNKMAVVASLASLDSDSSRADFDSDDNEPDLNHFTEKPKKKRMRTMVQGFHEEYPHPPTTDRWRYRARSNTAHAGLIPRSALLATSLDSLNV